MENPILIIGGGIAGLTTAQEFERRGIPYLVFEAVPEIRALGAGITLAGNAMLVMEKLGLAEEIKKQGHLLRSLVIQDSSGKPISKMDTEPFEKQFNMHSVAIHRAKLHEVLLNNLPKQKLLTGKRAVDFVPTAHGVKVLFEDRTQYEGAGAVIADGIHSPIRKRLLPESEPRYSGYTCWRAIVEDRWNLTAEAFECWGKQGRFGYVPIGSNQVYWFACKNAPSQDERMKKATIHDIQQIFSSFVHPIPEIIRNTAPEALIWNDIADLRPLKRYAFDKILFIGDAAHATTPNLGQGACQAVEDAHCLAELITSQSHTIDQVFREFETRRLKRVKFIVNTSYRLGRLAQWENGWLIAMRNTLFRILPESVSYNQTKRVLGIQ